MSTTTPNFNLFKYSVPGDNNLAFNIENALNQNWDKIDAHTHSGYAAIDHTHSGYATVNHTHSGYASTNHTHSGMITTSQDLSQNGYVKFSNGFLVNWIYVATNNSSWNEVKLPCAYTTTYYMVSGTKTNSESQTASDNMPNMKYGSTTTTLKYGTLNGNSRFGSMMLCYGY